MSKKDIKDVEGDEGENLDPQREIQQDAILKALDSDGGDIEDNTLARPVADQVSDTIAVLNAFWSKENIPKKTILNTTQALAINMLENDIIHKAITRGVLDVEQLAFIDSMRDHFVSVDGQGINKMIELVYGMNGMHPENRGLPGMSFPGIIANPPVQTK
jgi:hypothetical protein